MNSRKGAKSIKDIPSEILVLLNTGQIESVNLTEWLAVDHSKLIKSVLNEIYQDQCLQLLEGLSSSSSMQQIKVIGKALTNLLKSDNDTQTYNILKCHLSDSVRCWAAYIIGSDSQINFLNKLEAIKYYAADHHFGVREIAWMAIRSDIEVNLDVAIRELTKWSTSENENLRRFSTEAIRPIGVWASHIHQLKSTPEIALPILENLKMDSSRYVQDSVANWLNDASKSNPEFVKELCKKWLIETNNNKSTTYITKKALRTIYKK